METPADPPGGSVADALDKGARHPVAADRLAPLGIRCRRRTASDSDVRLNPTLAAADIAGRDRLAGP
jgi:hypothetical protein